MSALFLTLKEIFPLTVSLAHINLSLTDQIDSYTLGPIAGKADFLAFILRTILDCVELVMQYSGRPARIL